MIYANRNRPLQYINGNSYLVHAIWKIPAVIDVHGIKKYLGCDIVFKNDKEGVFYFCNEIQDVQVIDEKTI